MDLIDDFLNQEQIQLIDLRRDLQKLNYLVSRA
jgi:hypothetical protein